MTTDQIFRNPQGKLIGTLTNGTYRKLAQKSKHFMRIFDAWGIEAYAVDAWQGKCSSIRIEETENAVVWEVPVNVFLAKAFKRDFATPQYFLERKYWMISNKKGQVLQERTMLREELEANQGKLPL